MMMMTTKMIIDHDYAVNDGDRNNEGGSLLEKMTVAGLQSSANGTTWLTR